MPSRTREEATFWRRSRGDHRTTKPLARLSRPKNKNGYYVWLSTILPSTDCHRTRALKQTRPPRSIGTARRARSPHDLGNMRASWACNVGRVLPQRCRPPYCIDRRVELSGRDRRCRPSDDARSAQSAAAAATRSTCDLTERAAITESQTGSSGGEEVNAPSLDVVDTLRLAAACAAGAFHHGDERRQFGEIFSPAAAVVELPEEGLDRPASFALRRNNVSEMRSALGALPQASSLQSFGGAKG